MQWALKSIGNKSVARSRKEFLSELKARAISVKQLTPPDYRDHLLQRLGIYDAHFFQVFRTAVAYAPLDKIEDFIINHICHMEDNIDISKMRAAIHEYHRMQRDMAEFQGRQRELTEINGIHEDFTARYETYETQEYLIARAKAERLREEQLAAEAEMTELEGRCEWYKVEEAVQDAAKNQKKQRADEIISIIATDPATKRIEALKNAVEICNNKIDARESKRKHHLLQLEQRVLALAKRLAETDEGAAREEFSHAGLAQLGQELGLYRQYTKETVVRPFGRMLKPAFSKR
jgi:hypothetical protein